MPTEHSEPVPPSKTFDPMRAGIPERATADFSHLQLNGLPNVGQDDEWTPQTAQMRPRSESERERQPRAWNAGSITVRTWDSVVLSVALMSLGLGVVGTNLFNALVQSGLLLEWAWAGPIILWMAMVIPVLFALARNVPRGLFQIRPVDVVVALGIGVGLRVADGFFGQLFSRGLTWPSFPVTFDGALPASWWMTWFIGPVLLAPIFEEVFFRGVVLATVYRIARRVLGNSNALAAGVAVSTLIFVLTHVLTVGFSWQSTVSLTVVGLVLGSVVARTGRIWGAIVAHAVFNGAYVALALVGTAVGVG